MPALTATCLMRLSTAYFGCDTWLSLAEVAEMLFIDASEHGTSHQAATDARVAAHVLRKMQQKAGHEP